MTASTAVGKSRAVGSNAMHAIAEEAAARDAVMSQSFSNQQHAMLPAMQQSVSLSQSQLAPLGMRGRERSLSPLPNSKQVRRVVFSNTFFIQLKKQNNSCRRCRLIRERHWRRLISPKSNMICSRLRAAMLLFFCRFVCSAKLCLFLDSFFYRNK